MNKPKTLLIPGPVGVCDDVLQEMSRPVQAHYGPDYMVEYNELLQALHQIFQTKTADIYVMPGTGSGGLDACIGSLIEPGDPVLVLNNGGFGIRLQEISTSYRADVTDLKIEWGKPITPEIAAEAMAQKKYKLVALVQNETSTGVENPVKEIAAIAKQHGALVLVDAVSSLGATELKMDEWGLDMVVTSTQKGLESPPGLTVVAVSPATWQAIDARQTPPTGWYFNLLTWRKYGTEWGDWHPSPVTMAINNVWALKKACQIIMAEGLEARFAKHRETAAYFRRRIREIGLSVLPDEEVASNTVTAVWCEGKLDPTAFAAYLTKEHDIQIAGGLWDLKGKIFRIGHMGRAQLDRQLIDKFLAILHEYMEKNK